jgi:hypothetical protein
MTKETNRREPDQEPAGPAWQASHTGDSHASHGAVSVTGVSVGDITVHNRTVLRRGFREDVPRVPEHWPERRTVMIDEVESRWVGPQLDDVQPRLTRLIDLPLTVSVRGGPPEAPVGGVDPLSLFGSCRRQMLILGEQGSGKSTLMLRVMRALLEVRDNPASVVPVPVVVPPDRSAPDNLSAWFVNRVRPYFNEPVEVAWLLRLGLVMPCLEGLDAVAESHLASWATAIRRYLDSRPGTPMMVACQESTAESLNLGRAFTGTVRILPLSGGALDAALAALGDEGRRIEQLLAENPNVREWCTTPLMLSVVGAVDHSRAWDEPPFDEVGSFAIAAGGSLITALWEPSAQARQNLREQYAVLRQYVRDLLDKPVPVDRRRSEQGAPAEDGGWNRRQLQRGLRGLAAALREARQEYIDTVGLLAASDPAEARRLGMRHHAPSVRYDLLSFLAVAALVLGTKSYALAPHVLVLVCWLILMLWYTQVYGGLMEAPALRWVGRWTHVLPGRPLWPVAKGALSWFVIFCYASWTGLPVGTASVIGAVMAGTVVAVGCGAGLVKFRMDKAEAPPRRGLARVAVRAGVTAVLLGPVLASAAWWCAFLSDGRSLSVDRWATDSGMAVFCVWTVTGGYALVRHGLDRVQLALVYHVPWRLSAFLSTAARRGFLVATGNGYKFPNTTIQSAVETALADPPAGEPPSAYPSSVSARGYPAESLFDAALDETLARREVRRRVAAHPRLDADQLRARVAEQRPALLRDVGRLESDYRDLLARARDAEDDAPGCAAFVPLSLLWLFVGISPLWPLFFPGDERIGPLAVGVAVALTLSLLAVPLWIANRTDEAGYSTASAAVAYLVVAMVSVVMAVIAGLNHLYGREEIGEISLWRVVAVMPGSLVLLGLVAVLGLFVGRALDRLYVGPHPSWAQVNAAFDAWITALEGRVDEEVEARLGTRSD